MTDTPDIAALVARLADALNGEVSRTAMMDLSGLAAAALERLAREIGKLQARAELAEEARDEHLRLKNELVAKAYPAMDERDALRAALEEAHRAWKDNLDHTVGEIIRAALQSTGEKP